MANIVNFTDKQFENRLNDNLEELVQGKKAVESPTAFLLGGQPGSGKTSLRSAILEETQGNVIVIDKEEVAVWEFLLQQKVRFALRKKY